MLERTEGLGEDEKSKSGFDELDVWLKLLCSVLELE